MDYHQMNTSMELTLKSSRILLAPGKLLFCPHLDVFPFLFLP